MKPINLLQHYAILLATYDNGKRMYNQEKSYLLSESGGEEVSRCGRKYWVGEFTVKLWHRGTYHFKCWLEDWADGTQHYAVDHNKVGQRGIRRFPYNW